MVNEDEDRFGSGERPPVPPRVRQAGDLPRLQGLQHPARLRLHRQALRFRAGERRAGRVRHPHLDTCHGDPGLRGARVHHDGAPDVDERRVQLRGGPAGAPHGEEVRGQGPAPEGAEPGGVGQAHAQRPQAAGPDHGPAAGGAVLRDRGEEGGGAGVPVPQPPAQAQAQHEPGGQDVGAAQGLQRLRDGHVRLRGPHGGQERRRRRRGEGEN
ncbi:unnamed protein product [Linum tenue]|nr:unnamed protein product [Linum tenue]